MADWILPKGIVVNAPNIGDFIESFSQGPVDADFIEKMWKVFTTTSRHLRDPTAERLENFWWRIMGSRKRELDGMTVADLFTKISHGETFVPLFSPYPRYEGSPPTMRNPRRGGSSSTIAPAQTAKPDPALSSTPRGPSGTLPPILKNTKERKKSTGPRPTARFISPEGSLGSSSTSPHGTLQPPSPDPSASARRPSASGSGSKKGHVVSAASKKKRPVIVRRKSSQSSGEALTGKSPIAGSPAGKGKAPAKSRFQEQFSPDPAPESPRRVQDQLLSRDEEEMALSGDPGPSSSRAGGGTARYEDELTQEELEELEIQRSILAEANARMLLSQKMSPESHRSDASDQTVTQSGYSSGKGKAPMYSDSKSAASTGQSSTTSATGQMVDVGGDGAGESVQSKNKGKGKGKGKGKDPEMVDTSVNNNDIFAKRPVPPIGSSAAPATNAMARSKSQLSLLLEKDRARSGSRGKKE